MKITTCNLSWERGAGTERNGWDESGQLDAQLVLQQGRHNKFDCLRRSAWRIIIKINNLHGAIS